MARGSRLRGTLAQNTTDEDTPAEPRSRVRGTLARQDAEDAPANQDRGTSRLRGDLARRGK